MVSPSLLCEKMIVFLPARALVSATLGLAGLLSSEYL